MKIDTEAEFDAEAARQKKRLHADFDGTKWEGPNHYQFRQESRRCPKACCYDSWLVSKTNMELIREIEEKVEELQEEIQELLKEDDDCVVIVNPDGEYLRFNGLYDQLWEFKHNATVFTKVLGDHLKQYYHCETEPWK